MLKTLSITLASLSLTVAGCALDIPAVKAPSPVVPLHDSVVRDTGERGSRVATVELLAPDEAAYKTQAIVHKWVANDIHQYDVVLKVWDGAAYVDFATPLKVSVPRKGTEAKTKAVFTNLKQGKKYQAQVTAKGDNGGTAATLVLNDTPATAEFDFTATQDVQDTLSAAVKVVFNAVSFSGSATTTVEPPADGTYANPTAAETGTAQ